MTNKSNLEQVEKVETEKLSSSTEDSSNDSANAAAHKTDEGKHEANRPTKAAKSKREIMEELSRERFPWEE